LTTFFGNTSELFLFRVAYIFRGKKEIIFQLKTDHPRTLFCSSDLDLDLDPMTLICELDLKILKNLRTKSELSWPKVRTLQTETDRQMRPNAFAGKLIDNNVMRHGSYYMERTIGASCILAAYWAVLYKLFSRVIIGFSRYET